MKAFKFTKGDIIQVIVNPLEKTIAFKKNTETYQIPFETINGDELSPCVLFYYINDEVEFLPNFKAWLFWINKINKVSFEFVLTLLFLHLLLHHTLKLVQFKDQTSQVLLLMLVLLY